MTRYFRSQIGTKIFFLTLMVIFMTSVLAYLGLRTVLYHTRESKALYDRHLKMSYLVGQLRWLHSRREFEFQGMLDEKRISQDRWDSRSSKALAKWGQVDKSFTKDLAELSSLATVSSIEPAVKMSADIIGAIEQLWSVERDYQDRFLVIVKTLEGKRLAPEPRDYEKLAQASAQLQDLQSFSDLIQAQLKQENIYSLEKRNSSFLVVVFFYLLGAFAVLILTLYLVRSILSPLLKAVDVATRIKAGERHFKVFKDAAGEPGVLLKVLSEMLDNISRSERELKAAHQNLESILATFPIPLVVLNKDRRIIRANPRFREEFDTEISKAGEGFFDLKNWENPHLHLALDELFVRSGELKAFELQHSFPNLGVKTLLLSGKWVETVNLGEPSCVLTMQDITFRKEYEKRLITAHQKALAASQAKSQFLANISHEIRTPMNAIVGMTDLLLETFPTQEQKRYLQIIENSSQSLLNILNDILDISKVEVGELKVRNAPTLIRHVIESVMDMLALRAHEKGLSLEYHVSDEVPLYVLTDCDRLKQILINLVGNSIKFTNDGFVRLQVSCKSMNEKSEQLRVEVIDSGIGIPDEHLQTIFEKFRQVDSSVTREYGGTGLGLAICKELVNRMNGRIWAKSELEKGSTFFVELNLSKIEFSALREPIVPKNIRAILIAPDSFFVMPLESYCLRLGLGFEVVRLMDVNRLKPLPWHEGKRHIVILDEKSPVHMNILRELASREDVLGTILLVNSTFLFSDELMNLSNEKSMSYLLKPVKESDFQIMVRALIEGGQVRLVSRKTKKDKPTLLPSSMISSGVIEALSPETRPRVLIVDDSFDNRELLRVYLKDQDCELFFAENGIKALEMFEKGMDLVLLDIQMPEMDGYTTVQRIREQERAQKKKSTPVLALTAYALKEEIEKSLRSGFTEHISKPIRKADLLEKIKPYLLESTQVSH